MDFKTDTSFVYESPSVLFTFHGPHVGVPLKFVRRLYILESVYLLR